MIVIMLVLGISLSDLWQRMTRDTSSHAANVRGSQQYEQKKYAEATASFDKARKIAPTPQNAFNVGTSQIADGKREEGSSMMEKALADPKLRADALYNRGNSALAANAYDYAIRDYIEALRLRPNDKQAKRNLEIAIARKHNAEQRPSSGAKNNPQSGQQSPQPAPSQGQQKSQPKSDANVEALLRSVQQQEQEELQRMHQPRSGDVPVGW